MNATAAQERPDRVAAGAAGDEAARDALRAAHGVRLIAPAQEGLGLDRQPAGVYGFVSAPAVPQAPLYARPIYQSYEAHKRADGTTLMLAYVTPEDARALTAATGARPMQLFYAPQADATVLVAIPYARMRSHKEHSQRLGGGLHVDLEPVTPA
ncbi:MAG: hypothetical protein KGN76_10215 [Acidobacteriota bacterium]|nr:hypothetical protein [Acidobacteriota bacterium]